ncbi:hypothetical protein H4Q26_014178 [Puccinia striiformis f. sp. tritici PST-130]|nr:hypothetical protein H4Q26_014178 [Puccinia striiformis f. sp. tritici PST-130]
MSTHSWANYTQPRSTHQWTMSQLRVGLINQGKSGMLGLLTCSEILSLFNPVRMRLGFRTPGKAILIALWLSKNVMNAPNYGRARFTTDTETYPMDGEDMAYGYFFDKDGRNFKSFAKMAPGAGQGVFTSTLTNSKSRVNMGNVFPATSHDLAVVFDERLLLMLACQHADKDQGNQWTLVPRATCCSQESTLLPQLWCLSELDDASAWQKFRLVAYKLEEQPSIRLSFK